MATVGAYRASGTEHSKPRSKRARQSQKRRSGADAGALRKAVCEALELRLLLSAALDSQIPTTIPVNTGAQTLLAPADNFSTLGSNSTTVASSVAYRFVLNNAAAGQTTLFTTSLQSGFATDTAIALYDASGNRLVLQDANPANDNVGAIDESLSIPLQSGQMYTVEFFALASTLLFGANVETLDINPGPQATTDTLALNPATGSGSLSTSSAPDAFTSSTDVRYFSVNLLDAGQAANLQITPNGPDTAVDAALFEQSAPNGPWSQISTATLPAGTASANLSVTPPAGADITDGVYELALAPLNFTAAAEPVTITATASPLLLPASVNPASVQLQLSENAFGNVGTVTGGAFQEFSTHSGLLGDIIAPVSGPMTVSYSAITSYAPLLGIYGSDGTQLLDVASSTTARTTVTTTFNAVAGTTYYLSLTPNDSTTTSGAIDVTATQNYTPTAIPVGSTIATQSLANLGNGAGVTAFHLTPPVGSNYLAIQLAPGVSTLQTQISISAPLQTVQTYTASGDGQPVTVVIDESQLPGPYDVLLSGIGGTGVGATFQYVALTTPTTIPINQLPTADLNLATGGLTSSALPVTTGTPTGVQYFQLATNAPLTQSTYTATSSGGAAAVLLYYVQNGSVLQLADAAAPNAAGVASTADEAPGSTLNAVVALPVNFSGTGTVQLSVAGPVPQGIGVSFVPNALPNQPPPAGGFQSTASVDGATLSTPSEVDLYFAQLPNDLSASTASLVFTPADLNGPLNATISVLNSSNVTLASGTNTPGQPISVPVSGLTPGETLRFLVQPVNGTNIGDGGYSLSMTVNTTDPRPYLVTEQTFFPFTTNQVAGQSYLPNVTPTAITFSPTSTVTATGNFTSSVPYNNNGTGSIQVYAINFGVNFGPSVAYQVTTTDNTPNVNTNFALFQASSFDSNNNPVSFVHVPGTAPSFDYFPSDRSQIDARIVVNNTDLDPTFYAGDEFPPAYVVYVVVMNEQGTLGSYNISVAPAPVVTTGPGTTSSNAQDLTFVPNSGFVNNDGTQETINTTGYTVQTPADMASGSAVTLTARDLNSSSGESVTVTVGHVTSTGIILLVGTFGGTIGSSTTVSIPITGLGAGGTYIFSITSTPFPSGGLGLTLSVPQTAGGPAAVVTGNVPQDSSFNSAIPLLQPQPTGALSSTFPLSNGSFSTVFSVAYTSLDTLKVAYPSGASNVDVALYQCGQEGHDQFNDGPYTSGEVLRDFTTTPGKNGLYTLTDVLFPGTYVISGTGTASGTATVTGSIPPVPATVINVEPTTGSIFAPEDSIINNGAFASSDDFNFPDSRYSTSFFALTVPGNTNGQPISVTLFDNDSNTGQSTVGVGTASITLWRFANGVYTEVGSAVNALNDSGTPSDTTLTSTDTPVGGAQYFIGVELDGFETPIFVTAHVPVFVSGLPDFNVAPIQLLPDFGQTLVQSIISNSSFTSAPAANYSLQLGSETATRDIPALAPFGSYVVSAPYNPVAPTDAFSVVANPTGAVPELISTNNSQSAVLSSVDPSIPTVQIALSDPLMTAATEGPASPGVDTDGKWGRYISGVTGQDGTITVTGADPDGNLYGVNAVGPTVAGKPAFQLTGSPSATTTLDFGSLGTNVENNLIDYYAISQYGLRSETYQQFLDVVAPPSFLTGGLPSPGNGGAGGAITFAAATHSFTYTFEDDLISDSDNLSDLLGFSVPLIGNTENSFVLGILATGTGGLDPTVDIPFNFNGNIQFEALSLTLLNKTFNAPAADPNFVFTAQTLLDGRTLVPSSGSVELQLSKINLLTIMSPTIPLATIGVPGVASLTAGVKFSLAATLALDAKLGVDQTTEDSSGFFGSIGVMSPSFFQPALTASAAVVGQVSVLGFNLATLTGSINATLSITLGLDNNVPGAIIPFSDIGSHVGTSIDASLSIGIAASVPILGNVFSYTDVLGSENIANTIEEGIFLTDPPSFAAGKFLPPAPSPTPAATPADAPSASPADSQSPTAAISNGSTPVGMNPVDASPQIAIDSPAGAGMSVQVMNVAAGGNPPLGNLTYCTRASASSGWSSLTTLPSSNDDSDPVLAMTNDGTGSPAVAVYDADNVAGAPATQTYNQRLDASDIRYRYFNGTSWGPEISLTNDNLYDSQQSTAFDAAGDGVLAFVHNTDPAPINSSGMLDSDANEIEASDWNSTTHTFGTPVVISTGNGVDNSQPSTFVDSTGKRYIVWIQSNGTTSQLMFSTSTGSGAWSAPAPLSITGLPAGGTFTTVAIGSDGAGRATVIFGYQIANPDGTLSSTLYERPATTADFTSALPAVQLAQNSDYSGLRTTNAPSGSLVVYWEGSTGQANQIYETTITDGVATTPTQVTDDPNVASEPSAAVDTNGTLQVLYANNVNLGGTSQGNPTDPSVGAPVVPDVASSSVQDLPQLSFTQGLSFDVTSQSVATTGSQITGTAVVANRGLAAANVTLTAYDGVPSTGTAIGTQTFTLQPGATYNVSQPFTVLAGTQTYSLQLTTTSGQAFDTTENLSSTTLTGLVDLESTGLTTPTGTASAGQATTLTESFQNESNAAIGQFAVTLYSGDPEYPALPLTVLDTETIFSLAANASDSVSFPVTIPDAAGDYVYTAVVDSNNVIPESNETNNESRFEVVIKADPAIFNPGTGAVTATLLNSSSSNNVQVVVNVENNGPVPLFNVPIDLEDSLNSGPYVSDGQMVIPELDPGTPVVETFTVTALAGDNVFVGSIDSSEFPVDSNLSNDTGVADLFVPGLPTLAASVSLSSATASPGQPLTLTANLSNTGIGDANGVPLVVLAALTSGGPSYVVGTGTANLAGLGSVSVPIFLNTTALVPGAYTITLQIDPDQTVLQGSEAGNTVTTPLTLTAPPPLPAGVTASPGTVYFYNTTTNVLGLVSGTLTLNNVGSPSSLTLDVSADGANSNLVFDTATYLDSLTLTDGATAQLVQSGTDTVTGTGTGVTLVSYGTTLTQANTKVLELNRLSIPLAGATLSDGATNSDQGTLDLTNNAMILNYTAGTSAAALAAADALTGSGSDGGVWNGTGITSSNAEADNNNNGYTAIGVADNGDLGYNTFAGQDVSSGTQLLFMYTYNGDADLNGRLNITDTISYESGLKTHPGGPAGSGWEYGSLDYGATPQGSLSDLQLLEAGFRGYRANGAINISES